MSHHIIKIENLHYRYPNGSNSQEALAGVNCEIHHGTALAIVGANGSGKSTLLRHLNGILLANSGSIHIGDTPVVQSTLKTIRKTVGMVFQDADDQLFMPTVYDEIAFGLINIGFPSAEINIKVTEVLEYFHCAHLAERAPFNLSGGEKRKITLAVVFALSPDILLMDEPTANLDARSRRETLNLIAKFSHTRIIATHDLDLVLDLCSRVIILNEGKIVADNNPTVIFQNRELLEQYNLEPPLKMQSCPVCSKS